MIDRSSVKPKLLRVWVGDNVGHWRLWWFEDEAKVQEAKMETALITKSKRSAGVLASINPALSYVM